MISSSVGDITFIMKKCNHSGFSRICLSKERRRISPNRSELLGMAVMRRLHWPLRMILLSRYEEIYNLWAASDLWRTFGRAQAHEVLYPVFYTYWVNSTISWVELTKNPPLEVRSIPMAETLWSESKVSQNDFFILGDPNNQIIIEKSIRPYPAACLSR